MIYSRTHFLLIIMVCSAGSFENNAYAQNNKIPAGWEKYDFMPGYQVAFYDDFSGDRVNEKPIAWKLIEGRAEVILFNNQRWLRAINECFVAPQIEALPAQFSLEMDFYVTPRGYSGNYRVDVYGQTDNEWAALTIEDLGAYFKTSWGLNLEFPLELQGRHRLAMMATNEGVKCYVDSIRVVSAPKSGAFQPRDLEIFMPGGEKAGDDKCAITNVRLAYLDKNFREQIKANRKIVSYGIPFEAGAATPKPEAFATLKELAVLLQNELGLNLSIECHVNESDDESVNNRLSQQRAAAIREMLIGLYKIDGDRLRAKGWGSSKPLKENDTVDGRAANRRVEFVEK
jgi:outer membrane protein OmpA-like peptidoglycan-associated protein